MVLYIEKSLAISYEMSMKFHAFIKLFWTEKRNENKSIVQRNYFVKMSPCSIKALNSHYVIVMIIDRPFLL